VQLIFYYVGFMALGDVADYLIGLGVERVWPQASLLTFLALYFVSPVDRLAAGGEDDRAESQQTSRKVIFVFFLAENARGFAAVHSERAFHRFA
jgi:hypothetical protein